MLFAGNINNMNQTNIFILLTLGALIGMPGHAQTLKVCLDSPPLKLDLHKAVDTSTIEVMHKKVFESLVKFKAEDKSFYTQLASNIKFVAGKKFIVKLKPNVHFHSNKFFKPTRPMNADDVVFSFRRQMKKYSKTPLEFKNYSNQGLNEIINDVVKKDDRTIEIRLNKMVPSIYQLLSQFYLSIYSKEYYSKLKRKNRLKYFSKYPIGTGPFSYNSMKKKAIISMSTFKKYHGKKPKFNNLNYYIVTDNDQRTALTLKGKCHITHNPSWGSLKEIKQRDDLNVISYPENNILYLAFNTRKKPVNDKNLRFAISYALNTKKYIEKIFFGYAKRADHIITPNFKEYSSEFYQSNQDLELSKEFLAKSNYKKGDSINLWTIAVPRTYCPDGADLATMIKQDLAKVGIKVKIHKKQLSEFLSGTGKGEHDIALAGFADLNSQQEILLSMSCNSVKSGSNKSLWCNNKFDILIQRYLVTKDKELRKQLLHSSALIFNKELPRIHLAYMSKKKIVSSKISKYVHSTDSSDDYSQVEFLLNTILDKLKKKGLTN